MLISLIKYGPQRICKGFRTIFYWDNNRKLDIFHKKTNIFKFIIFVILSIKMISIIIPTYNEEKDILDCLKSLERQTYKNFEIIIIDDGSTDETIKKIREFSKKDRKIRILNQKHKGPGAARNLGAKYAKGEILIFVDADMTFDKDYIKNLINPLEKKEIIGTTHETEIAKNIKNIWSNCWGRIRVSKKGAKKVKIFRAIKKDFFLKRGGFDPKYGYADDQTFWFKYRIKPIVAKNTICYHKNPETLKSVYNQSRWIGSSSLSRWLKIPIINWLVVGVLFVISPPLIIILAIKKTLKTKNYKIFFPWMLIFTTVRYFGTLAGYKRKILRGINFR